MKPSEQRLSEVCRQQTEAIVAQHVRQLFQRLPMLSGFWLRPDREMTELSVVTSPGYTAGMVRAAYRPGGQERGSRQREK